MCATIACTKQMEHALISKDQIRNLCMAFYTKTPSRDKSQKAEWTQQQQKTSAMTEKC